MKSFRIQLQESEGLRFGGWTRTILTGTLSNGGSLVIGICGAPFWQNVDGGLPCDEGGKWWKVCRWKLLGHFVSIFWHELPDIQTDLSTRTIISWKVEVLHRALHLYIILDIYTCPHIYNIYIWITYICRISFVVNEFGDSQMFLDCIDMLVGGWRCSLFDLMHRILC